MVYNAAHIRELHGISDDGVRDMLEGTINHRNFDILTGLKADDSKSS
jgi:hypothetical protein